MYVDCHNDTILKVHYAGSDFRVGSPDLQIDLPKIRSLERSAALFFAAWVDPVFPGEKAFDQGLRLIRRIDRLAAECGEDLAIATSSAAVESIAGEGRTPVVLSVEGGQAIDDDPANIERFYKEGVRLLTLSHNEAPRWVGSCADEEERGLDRLGREIVRAMNDVGMIVDLAHASEKSIRDVAAVTTRPIVSSHSAAKSVYQTKRGLSDDSIRRIAGTGGVIGIMFYPGVLAPASASEVDPHLWITQEFARIDRDPDLSPDEKAMRKIPLLIKECPRPDRLPGVDAVIDHIDHVVRLVGEDHAAIGSDFDGVPYTCSGLEHIGELHHLAGGMRERGYTEEGIDKILGGNMLRLMREVIG